MTKLTVDFTSVSRPAPRPTASSMQWSDEQNKIFEWFERGSGHLIIRARAGTGKTTTILEGVNRAPEQKILLAAFNKSIATELQTKIRNPNVEAKTLHGLGFAFLRRTWQGVRVDDSRADILARRACGTEAPDPIIRLVRTLHTKAREISPFASNEQLMDLAVRFDLLPDAEWLEDGWDTDKVISAARRAMDFAQEKTDIIDFADMIYLPIVLKLIRPWYTMVVVDEAQDMTEAQLLLATGACRGRIAVVGDDRQAIYAFRGADSGALDRLKTKLNAKELGLKTTYRCPRLVVAEARKIVPDYIAASSAPEGLIRPIEDEVMRSQVREGDFILSRTNAPLIRVCMDLLKSGRRARIKGRDIGKGLVALVKRLRPSLPVDLISKTTVWAQDEVERAQSLPEKAQEARMEFVIDTRDLIIALTDGTSTIAEVIVRAENLFADNAEQGSVMLSTVHRAKGLETHKVYLLAGTFRSGRIEEDNIRYVAITRSKSELYYVAGYER